MKICLKLSLLALAMGAAFVPVSASAAAYPTRPVTIIVPFSPGGPGDTTARYVAKQLEKSLGQPFIIENRAGANGVVAARVTAHKPADGYTLLQISSSHTADETMYPKRGYVLLRDFEPIASLNLTEMALIVRKGLPVNSVSDLIAYGKAHPGKLLFASSGVGSTYHLAGELFKTMTGVKMTHVPYRKAASARTDLIGGHVDLMFDALPGAIGLIKSKKVKVLATTYTSRSSALPNVPTVAETLPGFNITIFIGLMAPKGTPKAIADKLHDAINKVLAEPATKKFLNKLGGRPLIMSRAAFGKYLKKNIIKSRHLIKISGAKIN